MCGWMSFPTIPTELIEAIIDQIALPTPTNTEPGLTASTLSSCALTSRAFVFPSQKHIFHTIDLVSGVYYAHFHRLLLLSPYLGTHVRRLRLIDNPANGFSNGISSVTHLGTPLSSMLGFFPNLCSFGLSFTLAAADWDSVPEETRAASDSVFRMESVKEVELEFVFRFPVASLVSLARLKYLALGNVYLNIDEGIQDHESNWKPQRKVALEGLYLRGVSPGVIRTLTKTLQNSADAPPTLRKLALTPTFKEGFAEAVVELITACGSHITSFAWLPSIHFLSCVDPINISTLHHLRSLYFIITFRNLSTSPKPFSHTLVLLQQISDYNTLEKITLECHGINKSRTSEKSFADLWRPLDTALSAMGSGEPVFGNLKEVEIVLSVNARPAPEIPQFVMGQEELLPNVEARGVMVSVRTEKGRGESGLLDRLRQM